MSAEFYVIFARNIFFRIFWSGSCPVSYAYGYVMVVFCHNGSTGSVLRAHTKIQRVKVVGGR